jgi:hypothetical protein
MFTDAFRPLSKAASVSEHVGNADDGEDRRERDLRNFCCRIYGWSDEQAGLVDDVMGALLTAVARCAVIALRGEGDLVPIAHSMHRQLIGPQRPFVVCDPRRGEREDSARSPPNRKTSLRALGVGAGGSVCIRSNCLPTDYDLLAPSRRMLDGTQLFVCLNSDDPVIDMLCPPIRVASLAHRWSDLDRLIREYLADATRALGVGEMRIPKRLYGAVLWRAKTLADLEKVLMRIVMLKSTPSINVAAERLGMAHVSLSRWVSRRDIRRVLNEIEWDVVHDKNAGSPQRAGQDE